jgi:lysozyme
MNLDKSGEDFIKGFEQLRLKSYKPTKYDVWTIGWGHTNGVKEGDVIDQNVAEDYFYQDLAPAELAVNTLVLVPLSQQQFNALVSFAFNCGLNNLKQSTLLNCLNKKNYQSAAQEFLKWNHQNGQVLNGLTARREAERNMFLG